MEVICEKIQYDIFECHSSYFLKWMELMLFFRYKIRRMVYTIVISVLCSIILTSCNLVTMVTGDYSGLANRNFNALITAMENKDKSAVKALFMDSAINSSENFENSLDELLEYYNGKMTSYDDVSSGGEFVERNLFIGKRVFMSSYFVVETDGDKYHFDITECVFDSLNPGNVGIKSLYIINDKDFPDKDGYYQGDYKNTEGINIGKYAEYSEDTVMSREKFNNLLTAVENKDKDTLGSYFSKKSR